MSTLQQHGSFVKATPPICSWESSISAGSNIKCIPRIHVSYLYIYLSLLKRGPTVATESLVSLKTYIVIYPMLIVLDRQSLSDVCVLAAASHLQTQDTVITCMSLMRTDPPPDLSWVVFHSVVLSFIWITPLPCTGM